MDSIIGHPNDISQHDREMENKLTKEVVDLFNLAEASEIFGACTTLAGRGS